MKRIKYLIGSFLAAAAFVLLGVNLKANAATQEYGITYRVTTEKNTCDTATWNFTGITKSVDCSVGDYLLSEDGIYVGKKTFKLHTSAGYLSISSGEWYIPVPSGSAGTIKFNDANSTKTDRYYNLSSATGTVVQTTIKSAVEDGISFTSEDISTLNGKTYLHFVAAGGELKTYSTVITLTTGEFEATASVYTVNYYDGSTKLNSETVEEGKTISYTPSKMGYDFVGIYTDESLTTEFDSSTKITENKNLYCKFTQWSSETLGNGYALSLSLMEKFGPSLTSASSSDDREMTGTIYSLLKGNTCMIKSAKDVGDYGKSVYSIKTSGTMSSAILKNGITIAAPASGTLTIYALSGSDSNRTVHLFDSSLEDVSASVGNVSVANSAVSKIEFPIEEEGNYYLGADGSIYLYYIEFVPFSVTALQQEAVDGNYTYVRFIAKVDGVTDVTTSEATKLVFTMTYTDNTTREVDYTSNMHLVEAIQNNGSDYVATVDGASYTFAGHTSEYYVICVVRLTTSKFTDCKIHATLTYNGATYSSTDGTIGA